MTKVKKHPLLKDGKFPERITLEVIFREPELPPRNMVSRWLREQELEKRLRHLLYMAQKMSEQIARPSEDYSITLGNLRNCLAETRKLLGDEPR